MSKSYLTHEEYHEVRAALHERFPAVFGPRGSQPAPLKVGIREDLLARQDELGAPWGRVACFLRAWTRRRIYHEAICRRGPRIGLDGQPAGEVSESDVQGSIKCLGVIAAQAAKRRRERETASEARAA